MIYYPEEEFKCCGLRRLKLTLTKRGHFASKKNLIVPRDSNFSLVGFDICEKCNDHIFRYQNLK